MTQSVDLLLAEDNLDEAELTIRELRKYREVNTVFHAKDGEEALEFLLCNGRFSNTRNMELPPRLVMLDIQMPKLNGFDVLRVLKSNDLTREIPIILFLIWKKPSKQS